MTPIRPAAVLAVLLLALSAPSAQAAETYEIDPSHSYVVFKINHLGIGNSWGRFSDVTGSLTLDGQKHETSAVEIVLAADSVNTDNEKRDKHLRSPDFFNVKTFPEIRFRSTGVEALGADRVRVTGELELHGVKKTVAIDMEQVGAGKDPWGKERVGYSGMFTINRSDFGMEWGLDNNALADEVVLFVDIEAIKKAS
jgi:polyisoprenoid-binding protein YceI